MFKKIFKNFIFSKAREFPNWPYFDKNEINAVNKVIKSGKVNYRMGENGKHFEKQFSKYFSSNYSVAISNGTLALDVAYRSIGAEIGAEVITSPRTFIATASTASIQGLIPRFADVDKDSGNITVETIEPLINKNTKFISVVHLAGWPADMQRICDLAKSYNLKVVEDCAQAHGASINGKSVGTFGDIAAWSFCTDKILTTGGEGGMITTNKEHLYNFVWSFKDHGKNKKLIDNDKQPPGYKWFHDELGLNYRLTEMQSAIGIEQLKKLKEWNRIRHRNANILIKELSKLNIIRLAYPEKNFHHAWYKFHCYIKPKYLKSDWNRDRIIKEINDLGYPAFHGSGSEIYLEKCFKNFKHQIDLTPVTRELGQTSLMFLVHPTINYELMTNYAKNISIVIKNSSN